jgi:hypothetical protein
MGAHQRVWLPVGQVNPPPPVLGDRSPAVDRRIPQERVVTDHDESASVEKESEMEISNSPRSDSPRPNVAIAQIGGRRVYVEVSPMADIIDAGDGQIRTDMPGEERGAMGSQAIGSLKDLIAALSEEVVDAAKQVEGLVLNRVEATVNIKAVWSGEANLKWIIGDLGGELQHEQSLMLRLEWRGDS